MVSRTNILKKNVWWGSVPYYSGVHHPLAVRTNNRIHAVPHLATSLPWPALKHFLHLAPAALTRPVHILIASTIRGSIPSKSWDVHDSPVWRISVQGPAHHCQQVYILQPYAGRCLGVRTQTVYTVRSSGGEVDKPCLIVGPVCLCDSADSSPVTAWALYTVSGWSCPSRVASTVVQDMASNGIHSCCIEMVNEG